MFVSSHGRPTVVAAAAFAARWNAGERFGLPDEMADAYPTVSASSLLRWARRGGVPSRWHGNGVGAAIDRDPDIRDFIVGQIAHRPHLDCGQLYLGLRARFGAAAPPLRTLQRWVGAWRAAEELPLLALADPDGYRHQRKAAFGRADAEITRLNQVWEVDSTPQDIVTADGKRNVILGVIDVWSRRAMLYLAPTSAGWAVRALYRRAILKFGVPEAIRSDNGSDYVAEATLASLSALAIEPILCLPGQPDRKPFIERLHKTHAYGFQELLPGYVGHSVAERQRLRGRHADLPAIECRLTVEDLQAALDTWCDDIYGDAAHRGLDGATPNDRAMSWPGSVRRIDNLRALDLLLAPIPGNGGLRRVAATGLRCFGGTFISAELAAFIGREVVVRADPEDMGRVYAFDARTGEFLCDAVDASLLGADRAAVALAAQQRQREAVVAKKAELRGAAKRVRAVDVAREILDAARRTKTEANVVALPRPAVTHTSAALEAASNAIRDRAAPALTDKQAALRALLPEQPPAPPAGSDVLTKRARFAWARATQHRLAAGDVIDEADAARLARYCGSAEYRAMVRMDEFATGQVRRRV